jgi:hypothetical protein
MIVTAVLQDIERQSYILHSTVRLLHQFVYFGIGCQMHHNIRPWVWHAADSAREVAIGRSQILEQRGHAISPGVQAFIDTEDMMAGVEQPQRQVGADLATRSGD